MNNHPRIEIMDTTLRDGEQTSGVSFVPHEKLMIARLLLEDLKVDRIEVASARVSDGEFNAVKMICDWAARRGFLQRVEVLGFVDGKMSVDWIHDAGGQVINLLSKGSEKHCRYQLKKTLEEHLADIRNTVDYAHERGLEVNLYLEDWSNGIKDSPDYVFGLVDGLRDIGIRRFMLPDTLGILNPLQVIEFMRKMKKRYPDLHFDFHAHNDYDLAVSNVLAAVLSGVKGLHTTINGLGERAGNATLASVQAIKQQEIQNTVDELGIEQNEDDIQISLIQTYMQVLYAMESVRINQNTVEVSTAQRDRAVELLRAGSISKVDLAQLESQLSTDKYQLVVAQTNLDNYKLQLKQLLELDITEEIELVMPELTEKDILTPLPSKQTIYNTSLAVMPQIKSSELAVDIAELEKKKAKGAFLPSLSMNAGLGTGHLSGTDYAFGSQVWNSFNESVGLTISIPIFSNRQYKTAYNKAKYAITTSQLELLNTQKQLLQTVEGIYLDATSSQTQYTSATERLSYVKESYNLIDEQFSLGMKNTLELLTEKNNYLTAQQEQLQAKYMALMSVQLLNVYQKKPVAENY